MPVNDSALDAMINGVQNLLLQGLDQTMFDGAQRVGAQIQKELDTQLASFFRQLGSQWIGTNEMRPPGSSTPWADLTEDYKKRKPGGQRYFFRYADLPRVVRNSRVSRALRRKLNFKSSGKGRTASNTLRNELNTLDPLKVFGRTEVVIGSKYNQATRARRRAPVASGPYKRGQFIKRADDFVDISVRWFPKAMALPSLTSGRLYVEELFFDVAPFRNPSIYDKLTNPSGPRSSFRPLIGPYILYYGNSSVRTAINRVVNKYGANL